MNHLLLPLHPSKPHPQVPYLCSAEFVVPLRAPFRSYPLLYGLDLELLLERGDFGSLGPDEVDRLLQEWLFFGLLASLFSAVGVPWDLKQFVTAGEILYEGQRDYDVVTTASLPSLLELWQQSESDSSSQHIDEDKSNAHVGKTHLTTAADRAVAVSSLLACARSAVRGIFRNSPQFAPLGPFAFSIISLGETLHHAALHIYGDSLPYAEQVNKWEKAVWPKRRMIQSGWCLNRVDLLDRKLTSSSMYFVSALTFQVPGSLLHNHETCTEHKCNVHYLDRDTYTSRHLCTDSNCTHLGPTVQLINDALERGGIPLIKINSTHEGTDASQMKIHVINADLESPPAYVAFSHVWSDGRGNLQRNTLPACQLQHLKALVERLDDREVEMLFWLDTLCVPVRGANRRVAIGRMRRTYEAAAKVLVLDSELESESTEASEEELLLRILCCGWMRRLWTLQEGALARLLMFQFRERAVQLSDLEKAVIVKADSSFWSPLAIDAVSCSDVFKDFKVPSQTQITDLIQALQWRNTSWQQDETICLSILLDLDVEQIEATEPVARIAKFLSMVKKFPLSLMFLPGPRLDDKCFTWAPTSLMPKAGFNLPSMDEDRIAVQASKGLVVQSCGLRLLGSAQPMKDLSWIKIEDDHSIYRTYNLAYRQDGGPSWSKHELISSKLVAIILLGMLWKGTDDEFGALVVIEHEDERVIQAKFFGRIFVSRELGDVPREVLQHAWTAENSRGGPGVLWGTARRIEEKLWHIS